MPADGGSLTYSVAGEPVELYDLTADPGQERNVVEGNRAQAEELHAKYYRLLKECGMDEESLKLRSKLQFKAAGCFQTRAVQYVRFMCLRSKTRGRCVPYIVTS